MKNYIPSPYGKYNGNEIEYVLKALDFETEENRGIPWVTKFEEEFCKLSGSKYAIAVNSATSGLHAALVACGVKEGDEVIQPGLTVVMNSFTTILAGATPVYADIDKDTWNITAESISKKITSNTKVIMPVSLFGVPTDIDPIMKIAKEKNLYVIDDCAETICGIYKNKFAGSVADVAVFSFENKKHMSSGGEGGMIITNNEELAIKMRKFAGIGYKNLTASAGRTSLAASTFQDPNYQRHDIVGLNYRMTSINAAIGLAQLERIEHLVERRIAVGNMFLSAVDGCTWIVPQKTYSYANHTMYTFAFLYEGMNAKGVSWKEFYNRFKEKGGDGFYAAWVNPYLEPALKNKQFGITKCQHGLCPVAEEYQKKIMLFKTNYRDLSKARKNAILLANLIDEIGRN